jgi:PAS domain-containing protein
VGEDSRQTRIHSAFEDVPAALFVFEGPSHRILAANRLARGSTGDRPNLIGLEIRDALPELEGQQILEILDEAFSAPAAGQPERRVLLDRNGDGALEEGFFAWTFVPVDFDDGVAGIVVHAIENTELVRQRQAAESRAVASERRFQKPATWSSPCVHPGHHWLANL